MATPTLERWTLRECGPFGADFWFDDGTLIAAFSKRAGMTWLEVTRRFRDYRRHPRQEWEGTLREAKEMPRALKEKLGPLISAYPPERICELIHARAGVHNDYCEDGCTHMHWEQRPRNVWESTEPDVMEAAADIVRQRRNARNAFKQALENNAPVWKDKA